MIFNWDWNLKKFNEKIFNWKTFRNHHSKYIAYCGGLSIITPPLVGYNLKSLYGSTSLPYCWGTLKMFPYQFVLRGGQLALATELKNQTHPLVAFSSIGIFQGIIYGHVNQTWAHFFPKIQKMRPNMMRGILFAANRDMISQGIPFLMNDYGLGAVLATSFFSILLSQGFHNCQTIMQMNRYETYLSTIQNGFSKYKYGLFYKGYFSRVLMMMGVNTLNYLFLRDIWNN